MHVFQIVGTQLFYTEVKNDAPASSMEWKGTVIPTQPDDVLILDYETYWDTSRRAQLFSTFPSLKQISFIYSPYEAVGAFIRYNRRNISDEINVLDLQGDKLHGYTLCFSEGFYHFKNSNQKGKTFNIDRLIEDNLGLSPSKTVEFARFLSKDAGDQKKYGQLINEALSAFEGGETEYDDLLAILDQPEWAHIKLNTLIKFKNLLIGIAGIDASKDFEILGWLNTLFGKSDAEIGGQEKIYGAIHLKHYADQFYPDLKEGLDLEVYCYPDLIRVPVFTEASTYSAYTLTKVIEMMDVGSVTFFRGGRRIEVKTKNKMSRTALNINIDGNQNLVVNIGTETYLLA